MILNRSTQLANPRSATQSWNQLLLVCEASSSTLAFGTWKFTLEQADGNPVFTASDQDEGDLNRLTLMAAVRGFEFIDGPSSVTLLSNNRYLIRSLSDSLPRWRENDFVWEHFGRRIDVQHADLWRRIDRALSIHSVQACLLTSRVISTSATTPDTPPPHRERSMSLRIDSSHGRAAHHHLPDPPSDGLRRWLFSGEASDPLPPESRRRRKSSSDVLQTT